MRIALIVCMLAGVVVAEQRTQSFDTDPNWESLNNRKIPKKRPQVTQDFGYDNGAIGGTINRASECAFYAEKIEPKTLDDKLSAAGSFTITKTSPGSGMFFGFFNANQPGASGRPIGSLGLDFDCEHTGARLAVRLITAQNQSCGTFITPFIPGKFRPTALRNDGTRYTWKLDYDPSGAGGRGQFTFTLHGDVPKPGEIDVPDTDAARKEAAARFPETTTFTVDLPEGYKQQGTTFDHFGMMNLMKAGGRVTIHFDDLAWLDHRSDFTADPNWDARGNRATYESADVGGAHNFGYSPTHHATGKSPGEIGGTFWRTDDWAWYADKIGELSFNDRLEARGKVTMLVGGPDADMCFGFFRIRAEKQSPNRAGDFLGIHVGGPTRAGHLFRPAFYVHEKLRGHPDAGPRLLPGKSYDWSLIYDPAANTGNGAITARLGDESVTHNLKPGQKLAAKDARFDHFGMIATGPGGQIVKVFIDDLQYTSGSGVSKK